MSHVTLFTEKGNMTEDEWSALLYAKENSSGEEGLIEISPSEIQPEEKDRPDNSKGNPSTNDVIQTASRGPSVETINPQQTSTLKSTTNETGVTDSGKIKPKINN